MATAVLEFSNVIWEIHFLAGGGEPTVSCDPNIGKKAFRLTRAQGQ